MYILFLWEEMLFIHLQFQRKQYYRPNIVQTLEITKFKNIPLDVSGLEIIFANSVCFKLNITLQLINDGGKCIYLYVFNPWAFFNANWSPAVLWGPTVSYYGKMCKDVVSNNRQ